MIDVEVAYALPDQQCILALKMPPGSTVIRAIKQSGLLELFPELQLEGNTGIFSKKVTLNHQLTDGDRIEIYRPLTLSPNELRLRRAKPKR